VVVDGPREVVRLDQVIETLRAGIERMTSGPAWEAVRRAIKEYRQAQKMSRSTGW
jgi:hypothetical protein